MNLITIVSVKKSGIQQSAFSGPDFGHFQVRPEEMYPVFNAISVPRETPHETQPDAAEDESRSRFTGRL